MDERGLLDGQRDNLLWMLERIVECARSAGDEAIGRRPDAPSANSIAGIATHALGAAREHVLGWVLGREVPAADEAFDDGATRATIEARFAAVGAELTDAFEAIGRIGLDRPVPTAGRGPQPAWSVLNWAMLHAAEHAGAAELTRDLLAAGRAT